MAARLSQIEQEIARLQKQQETLLAKERPEALAQVNNLIQLYDLKPKEVHFKKKSKLERPQVKAMFAKQAAKNKANGIEKVTPRKGKTPIQYAQGDNTWSGRARKPKWVQAHLAGGGTLDQLRVQ